MKRTSRALYRPATPGSTPEKWNWRKEAPRWWDMSKARSSRAAPITGLFGSEKFRRTKAIQHFNVGTAAERNMAWDVNSQLHMLRMEGFHTALENGDALSARNAIRKYNAEQDRANRVAAHLFKSGDKHFDVLEPNVAPSLRDALRECLDESSQAAVSNDVLDGALLASNHELPLAAYYVNSMADIRTVEDSGVESAGDESLVDEGRSGAGVVSADVVEGHGGAVVVVGCDTVATSVSDEFLDLAKDISRTAATLPLDVEDPLLTLLTTQMHDSDAYVTDALKALSEKVGETITLRELSMVPWPEDGLLGWFVNNPRDRHPGQGGAVCFTLCLFDEVEFRYLEPEWKLRLQETFPHDVAQHCCLEPLWFDQKGRILKQQFLCPLPDHERMRYPSGMPTLFDWMQDQCVRHKITLTRFGLINTHLGRPTAKTWVSFSMEEHRYGKFSTAVDPAPSAESVKVGDYAKATPAEELKDLADEELWFNEPGQKSFKELEEHEEGPSGFENDDELMNSKQF